MRYKLAEGVIVDRVGDEVALTNVNGDVIVLNESAGLIACSFKQGRSVSSAVKRFADEYGLDAETAERDVRCVLGRLRSMGVLVPERAAPSFDGLASPRVSRRAFVAGVAATGITLLSCAPALGEESAEVANSAFGLPEFGGLIGENAKGERVWKDSLGREVAIPDRIERIAPYGPYAQAVLESIDLDTTVQVTARGAHASLVDDVRESAAGLAESTGSEGDVDIQAIEEEGPDLILDLATSCERLERRIDNVQDESDIPVVHMVASTENLPQVYKALGDLLGEEHAYTLADFCGELLVTFAQGREHIDESDIKRVYFGQGADGLATRGKGTLLDKLISLIGAENLAHDLKEEQCHCLDAQTVREWGPDVIVLSVPDYYESNDAQELIESIWKRSDMSKADEVLMAPVDPVPWLAASPLVMQTVGALWLACSVYPQAYGLDLEGELERLFKAFFHIDIGEGGSAGIVGGASKDWRPQGGGSGE